MKKITLTVDELKVAFNMILKNGHDDLLDCAFRFIFDYHKMSIPELKLALKWTKHCQQRMGEIEFYSEEERDKIKNTQKDKAKEIAKMIKQKENSAAALSSITVTTSPE